jgi:DNA polymerase (family 10)
MSTVTNKDAADILFNVATILELAEDNPYRIRAYRRAARLLLGTQQEAKLRLTEKKELDLPGLGPRLRRKLGELLSSGRMGFYVELCTELPPDIARLMQIPSVGPRTARRLNEELGLATATDVIEAAQRGKIRALYGFGEKRERQLLRGAQEVLAGRIKSFVPVPAEESDESAIERPAPTPMAPVPAQMNLPVAA